MGKRAIRIIAALAVLTVAVSGCGKGEEPAAGTTENSGAKTTVTTTSQTVDTTVTSDESEATTSGSADGSTTTTGSVGKTTTTTTTTKKKNTTTTFPHSKMRSPEDIPSSAKELNVCEYGADNTGKTDCTTILTILHASGKKVYYPNGTYLFNGRTLDFSGGVRFESQDGVKIRNSVSDVSIVNFDSRGNLIGLMQNHLEEKYNTTGNPASVKLSGSLVSPPLSRASIATKVDFVPYWYNDFGLTSTLTGHGGWVGWYDWRWNHHDCTNLGAGYDPYDPTRHPLLGWYRGDDPTVLDWQCYWLREYGINQAILLSLPSKDAKYSTSTAHWAYELMNNVPNAKKMNFAYQINSTQCLAWDTSKTVDDAKALWQKVFDDFYFKYDNIYCVNKNGKRYPVLALWTEDSLRYALDPNKPSDPPNLQALYKWAADAFKAKGYDGVCILARQPQLNNKASIRASLQKNGVLWYAAGYPENCLGSGSTYGERVRNMKTLDETNVYSVTTGMHTHDPHPSQWVCPGNTPNWFGELVGKAVALTTADKSRMQLITCYNMAEWSEGGPGLQPTVGDGFGYLEAIYQAIKK